MQIKFVQFIEPVSVGGDHGAINNWGVDKHGSSIKIEEKGSWFILTLGTCAIVREEGKPDAKVWTADGDVVRVPITNVSYVRYTGDNKKVSV